jgi:hypothetical protein
MSQVINLSYEDDFGLTISSPSHCMNVHILQHMYRVASNRAKNLNLTFSVPKTDLIHWRISRDNFPYWLLPVSVSGELIPPSRFVKWLGFWLQEIPSIHQHFTESVTEYGTLIVLLFMVWIFPCIYFVIFLLLWHLCFSSTPRAYDFIWVIFLWLWANCVLLARAIPVPIPLTVWVYVVGFYLLVLSHFYWLD